MNKLLTIAYILTLILSCAHLYQLDKDWDHIARTAEFEALRIKHGVKNTRIVLVEHGRNYYFNERGERCELR
jgi:hypothetical protein